MTLERLTLEMRTELANGNKFRKGVLSMMIAQIKRRAIDEGIRDNITEEFVDTELTKYEKSVKDTIAEYEKAQAKGIECSEKYANAIAELAVVQEFAPQLITDENEITEIVMFSNIALEKRNMGAIMKFLKSEYNGKMDMGAASKVLKDLLN